MNKPVKNINPIFFHSYHLHPMFSHFASRCGLWYWHPQIHPDGARAALRHGADWGPVQVHLPVCVWVHTDPQGHRQRLPGEQQHYEKTERRIGLFLWLSYGEEGGRFQDKRIEMCRSIDLCNLTATDHFNGNRICYQSGACERWTLTHRQKKKTCHIDKTSRRTSLCVWVIVQHIWLVCVSSFVRKLRQSMEICLSNTNQWQRRPQSEWARLSICLCVWTGSAEHIHTAHLNFSLLPYFLFLDWVSIFSLMSAAAFWTEDLQLEGRCI